MLLRATNTIVAQVGALKGMVDDFSLYSRSSRLVSAELSLNELIREVLVLYESMGVTIELRLDPDIPNIHADASLLRQVIHNLVQNALDAMTGTEGARMLIATGTGDGNARLVIEDNGSGVRDDMHERIFEPYVTTKPKGTGLGLAIVRKIIDEHGGTVAIANVRPHGARVEIALPITMGRLTGQGRTERDLDV
jgi:nitrogen fixation/metabolism regulation signal transduction histidine kinase